MEYSNQIGSRERKPWLLLIKNGRITPFAGESIPGPCNERGAGVR